MPVLSHVPFLPSFKDRFHSLANLVTLWELIRQAYDVHIAAEHILEVLVQYKSSWGAAGKLQHLFTSVNLLLAMNQRITSLCKNAMDLVVM